MSMKVENNHFHLPITGKMEQNSKKISDVIKLDKPITVDISKEAMERYRKTIQEQNKDKPTFDEMVREREMISKLVQPDEEIDYQFGVQFRNLGSGTSHYFQTCNNKINYAITMENLIVLCDNIDVLIYHEKRNSRAITRR